VLTGKVQEREWIKTLGTGFGAPRLDVGEHSAARFEQFNRAIEMRLE
jgi:hypothetical protein